MAEILELKKRRALSGWPMIIGWIAMLIFACHACTRMVGAGDTWVAMACGRHFVNHGFDNVTVEPFSANSHEAGPTEADIRKWPKAAQWIAEKVGMETVRKWHPTGWLNQNWLTHVIFYWLVPESSYTPSDTFTSNALVYWKFAIYILTVICVYYTGRFLGANPVLCAIFACGAVFVGRSFYDIRPAGYSNLLVAVYLLILVLSTYQHILYIWLIVPLTVFWSNVHGGYIYVFITLVPFVGLNFLTSISKKWFVSIGIRGVLHSVGAGIFALLGSIIFNPYHLTNLTHTLEVSVSKHAEGWRSVNEWHPAFSWSNPVGTGFSFLVILVLGIGLVLFWLFSRFLKPGLVNAPVNELKAQEKRFNVFSKIFGWSATVVIFWVVFISFSFLKLHAADFILCALFACILLLSICVNIHLIYLVIPLTLFGLQMCPDDNNYWGRYIYPFVLVPCYVTIHIIASMISENIKTKRWHIALAAGASVVTIILMVMIFDPFKFEFPMWHIGQFFEISRIWRPVYERNVDANYNQLFGVLYGLNIVFIAIWLALPGLKKIFKSESKEMSSETEYSLAKIDLGLIAIAALTIYMAIRSRRFITLAGVAACPLMAMFIDQMCCTLSASFNFYKHKRLAVRGMSCGLQRFFIFSGIFIVLFFGMFWGLKFKRVYLDPWPSDKDFSTVFIRMTASHEKPFSACKFIKDNKLKGKMFNYWTEGGFIAWGQEPDVETGKTGLQLFMDGRAQAAYDYSAYRKWAGIMFGGPLVREAQIRKSKFDYKKIGQWTSNELKKDDVWLILMPQNKTVLEGPFLRGIERDNDWQMVFLSRRQKLFVDITTPQGKKLFDGIFSGETVFPSEYLKNIIVSHHLILYGKGIDVKRKGLMSALKAFELNPSTVAMRKILFAQRFPELHATVTEFCENYLDEFIKNRDVWAKEDGFRDRIIPAIMSCSYLSVVAKRSKDDVLAQFYKDKQREYESAIGKMGRQRW